MRKALAAAGANPLRTGGADKLDPLHDEARRLGLTVTVGIWLGHDRHGFNYHAANPVAKRADDGILGDAALRGRNLHPNRRPGQRCLGGNCLAASGK